MGKLSRGGGKKTMIALTIKDKVVLHNNYMPFIKDGGLFIANRTEYELGDDVFILLSLMDETEKIPVAGKVVWIAKKGVKSPHTAGVGIQFSDPDNVAKDKIETYLAGSLNSTTSTATM
jgi:type IV pilus assembly protein PilZ